MSDCILSPVLTEHIESIWPEILPWAEEFCQHSQGSYSPDYIKEKLLIGAMQLWLVRREDVQAVILTEIRQTLLKEMVIVITTGEAMESWVHLIGQLEKFARVLGCQKLIGVSRPGWEKILKPFGYRKTHVQMEKML